MLKNAWALATALLLMSSTVGAQTTSKTKLAVVGLDHDHVWGLLKDIAKEPKAQLVAIADPHPELVEKAKKLVPADVKFFSNYVKMLDEMKPDGLIVTTANNRHMEVLREGAKRHINYSVEKPLATNAADARDADARGGGVQTAWRPAGHRRRPKRLRRSLRRPSTAGATARCARCWTSWSTTCATSRAARGA